MSSTSLTKLFYFYPRSPCGERPSTKQKNPCKILISIHALLAESDHKDLTQWFRNYDFYPRSPCGERLWGRRGAVSFCLISIHALLAESDRELV